MIDEESEALEDDPILRVAVFGRQVEIFLESDIGQYLLQCAQKDIDEATESLKKVDPFRPEEILKIQHKLQVAESVIGWLSDAVQAGTQANQTMRESP
jgi:hypothetical protein